jgi:hypothetical protein
MIRARDGRRLKDPPGVVLVWLTCFPDGDVAERKTTGEVVLAVPSD